MAKSATRIIYGIHSISPYNRITGEFYGTAKVVGEASFSPSGEVNQLYGGSSRFPWDSQDGEIKPEMAFKLKEFPDWAFELFLGKKPTLFAADTAGAVSTLVSKQGTLVGTTGIASIAVKAAAKSDLKFGKYVIKVISATTVDVFASSDADFGRGTKKTLLDDNNKVTVTPLTVVASTATEVPGFGIELTGGSGTIAMTVGDTAVFEVKPPSQSSMEVEIGGPSDVFPEFGCILMAQKKGSGELFEIDLYRCKGIGMPMPMSEKAFAEAEIKPSVFLDDVKGAIAKVRAITPS